MKLYRHGHRPLPEKNQRPSAGPHRYPRRSSRVDYEKLADKRQVEDSKTVRARVQAARERQLERFKGTKLTCNAEMGPTEVRDFCQTDASGRNYSKRRCSTGPGGACSTPASVAGSPAFIELICAQCGDDGRSQI